MNKTMKQEVSKRRITDPTFTYRKLKQELQNATLSEVQDHTVEEVVAAETEEEAVPISPSQTSKSSPRPPSIFDSRLPVSSKGRVTRQVKITLLDLRSQNHLQLEVEGPLWGGARAL